MASRPNGTYDSISRKQSNQFFLNFATQFIQGISVQLLETAGSERKNSIENIEEKPYDGLEAGVGGGTFPL